MPIFYNIACAKLVYTKGDEKNRHSAMFYKIKDLSQFETLSTEYNPAQAPWKPWKSTLLLAGALRAIKKPSHRRNRVEKVLAILWVRRLDGGLE